jgi:hypothetical protein
MKMAEDRTPKRIDPTFRLSKRVESRNLIFVVYHFIIASCSHEVLGAIDLCIIRLVVFGGFVGKPLLFIEMPAR